MKKNKGGRPRKAEADKKDRKHFMLSKDGQQKLAILAERYMNTSQSEAIEKMIQRRYSELTQPTLQPAFKLSYLMSRLEKAGINIDDLPE